MIATRMRAATRARAASWTRAATRVRAATRPAGRRAARPPEGFDRKLILPLILGSILNPINSSMIAVALVPIGVAFGAPPAQTVWLISALYLATAVGQPVVGRLVDMFGPRRLYLTGTALVGVAGLLAFFAPGLWVLVVARVLFGFGTSAAYPAAMFLIRSEARRTGMDSPGGVLTALAIANQVIAVVGPTLGGLLIGLGGWQAIFTVNVPLSAACLILGGLRLPRVTVPEAAPAVPDAAPAVPDAAPTVPDAAPTEPEAGERGRRPLDLVGMLLFTTMLVALLLFLMQPRLSDWYLPVLFAAAAAGLAIRELRVAEPFIDVRMLGGNVPLLATFARQVLIYTASYVLMYGYAQWLEDGRGLSASVTGLVVLPTFLVAIGVSALTGRSPGIRGKLFVGGATMVAATPLLLLVHAGSPIWLLVAVSAAAGVPQGLNGLANQNALYRQADPARMGSAAGLLRTFMYLGAIIAAAAVAAAFPHGAGTAGLHQLALLMAGCAVLLLAITIPDRSLRRHGRRSDTAAQPEAAQPNAVQTDAAQIGPSGSADRQDDTQHDPAPDPRYEKGHLGGSHDARRAHRARTHRSPIWNRRGGRDTARRR